MSILASVITLSDGRLAIPISSSDADLMGLKISGSVRFEKSYEHFGSFEMKVIPEKKPSEVLAEQSDAVKQIIGKIGGTNIRVFGSIAKGKDTNLSDIDLVIDEEQDRRVRLDELMNVQHELSNLLGFGVDLVLSRSISANRRHILNEAKNI